MTFLQVSIIILLILLIFFIYYIYETSTPVLEPVLEPALEPVSQNVSQTELVLDNIPLRNFVRTVGRRLERHIRRRMRQPNIIIIDNLLNENPLNENLLNENPLNPQNNNENLQNNNLLNNNENPQNNNENPAEFFENIQQHGNDSQNVHDPLIRKDITNKLLKIIEYNTKRYGLLENRAQEVGMTTEQYTMSKMINTTHEIIRRSIAYFNSQILELTGDAVIEKRQQMDINLHKIGIVLEKVSAGYPIVMSNGHTYREDFILNHVWDRINDEENIQHKEQLQIALIDNIIDCAYKVGNILDPQLAQVVQLIMGDTYTVHCINGRVARFITSLILLDVDPIISKPEMDAKEIANEAYSKAYAILNNELDIQNDQIQTWFSTKETDLTPDQLTIVKELEQHIKGKIADVLKADYKDILDSSELDIIITKAQAGIATN